MLAEINKKIDIRDSIGKTDKLNNSLDSKKSSAAIVGPSSNADQGQS